MQSSPQQIAFFANRWTDPDPSRDILVVSGLPRSGTSMMMRMLAHGGIDLFTDGLRQPDEDNPRGYFEAVQASRLSEDPSWVPQARGRAVKIVAPLLPQLPGGERYRILAMQRDFAAVIASQRVMLARQGRSGEAHESALLASYESWLGEALEWVGRQGEVAVLPCSYDDAVMNPRLLAERIAPFVGRPFDVAKAAAAVEPALRHHGSGI